MCVALGATLCVCVLHSKRVALCYGTMMEWVRFFEIPICGAVLGLWTINVHMGRKRNETWSALDSKMGALAPREFGLACSECVNEERGLWSFSNERGRLRLFGSGTQEHTMRLIYEWDLKKV